ncbi:MAG: AbrB/MazE/SpoVT family DNA-binding domain-containing protein [Haloplanus sp.]
MPTRKVQLTGSSTFTISLPKEWARDHGIEPGMDLTLSAGHDGELVIGAEQAGDPPVPEVAVDSLSPAAVRAVVRACYVAGVERFRLVADAERGFEADARRAVDDAVTALVGLDVHRETDAELELAVPIDAGELGVERTLLQLQFVALSMQSDAVAALVEGDDDLVGDVRDRATDARRKYALLDRTFQRTLTDRQTLDGVDVGRPLLYDYAVVARHLRGVARQATHLATLAADSDLAPAHDEVVTARAREARDVVDRAVDAVIDGDDPGTGYDLSQTCAALRDDLDAAVRTAIEDARTDDGDEAARRVETFCRALWRLDRTVTHAERIAERATEAAVRPR